MKSLLIPALLLVMPVAAFADGTPAPAAEETIPPPNCEKPAIPTAADALDSEASRLDTKNDPAKFQKNFDAWRACMKAYVDAQSAASHKHIAAANAAVKEVNDFIAQVNDAK